jgi:glycosyltransferase involved in cell wall biosynthesis
VKNRWSHKKLFYVGLEPYEARYTLQLTEWSKRAFERNKIPYVIVPGQTLDTSKKIVTGQVLDAHGRSYFAMSQIMNLVKMAREGEITNRDVIFFEDMFHPGIEALPYIFDQTDYYSVPSIWVRCLAQTIDPDDFTNVWGMKRWMDSYERMLNNFVTGVLATNEEMVAHMKIAGWEAPLYNISGLSFDQDEVRERVGKIRPWSERANRVVFAARFDQEKQPDFFMDLIERMHTKTEFVILAGGELRSNDEKYLIRARKLEREGKLKIRDNLPKNLYYEYLNDSRVLFNCALQDWVSNTVSEADALGCNVLYPAYRSFPETFANDPDRLYVPWSLDDAEAKMEKLLQAPSPNMGKIAAWNSGTIDRMLDIMNFDGEEWNRNDRRYRNHVAPAKY